MVRVVVVYDNEARNGFLAGWGFSCYVEGRVKVLFDTGWDGNVLLHNLELADVSDFDYIFLSHQHWDHIGGLNHVVKMTSCVVLPESFSKNLKAEIRRRADVIEVREPMKIDKGVYSTGELGNGVREQSMVVEIGNGNLVITGCSHPGLDVILARAEEMGRVRVVMGGFHGFRRVEILERYELVIPCHCTVMKERILKMGNSRECYAGCTLEL